MTEDRIRVEDAAARLGVDLDSLLWRVAALSQPDRYDPDTCTLSVGGYLTVRDAIELDRWYRKS